MAVAEREVVDINCFRDQPIHEAVAPIIWLHGTWRTDQGKGSFPNIPHFTYSEELQFASVGQAGLTYSAFSWSPEKKLPMHQESGFLRIQPDTNNVALIVAQNTGLAIVEEGQVMDQTVTLTSQAVVRMSFSRGSPVTSTKREFHLKSDRELEQVFYMATAETPLTEHLRATYIKVD